MWLSTRTSGPHLVRVLQCLGGQGLRILYDPGQRSASLCAVVSLSFERFRCVWCQTHSLSPSRHHQQGPSMMEAQLLCGRKGDPVRATWKPQSLKPFPWNSGFLEIKTGLQRFISSFPVTPST